MERTQTKRSWGLALFGLPFFAVGVGFIFLSITPTLYDGWRMSSWSETTGILSHAELKSSYSDGSTTYRVEANYRYRVDLSEYTSERVAINSGGDNIGDFQQNLGNRLEHLYRNNKAVTVYYDPSDPTEAVLDRTIRWGLLGFKMIFVLVFGGVGAGLMFFAFRGKRVIDSPEAANKPWLSRPEWAGNLIRSNAKKGLYIIWGFALVWNLISAPFAFMVEDIWKDEGPVALLVLLFPVIGVVMLGWAIKKTMEWRRFGVTTLRMDPFPGAIGGDVAGEIELAIPYDPSLACELTLSSIHSYISGSGKNRSRHESVEWQDSGYARVERSAKGMTLQFRFAVPQGLRESEEHSSSYYLWRLNINAEIPGVDLNRDFELPVYKTAERSKSISIDSTREVAKGARAPRAEDLLPLRRQGMAQELNYPMLRRPGRALMLLIFGGIFAGAGYFLWQEAQKEGGMLYFMSSIFSLVGWSIVVGSVYSAFNSLLVVMDGRRVTTLRKFMGFPVKRHHAAYHELHSVQEKRGASSSQQGSKHHIQYTVTVQSPAGELLLAEGISSHSKARLIVEFFEKQFKLSRI